jgi:hypothetical protein
MQATLVHPCGEAKQFASMGCIRGGNTKGKPGVADVLGFRTFSLRRLLPLTLPVGDL